MNGFMGQVLVVDLTSGKITIDRPDEAYYRRYLGGAALATEYVLRLMPKGADALGPDNVLVFAAGPITGTAISGNSRMSVNARSPLSNGIGDAQVGGFFPAELKFAGFDAVVVLGQSPKPVYIWVTDNHAEIRDASKYWGMGTGDFEDAIQADTGDKKVQTMTIGPAGENLVRYAAIVNTASRAAGRTGMGAVMGSKRLKSIVARGTMDVAVADAPALKALTQWGAKNVRINLGMAELQKYGTAATVMAQQTVGGLPTENWNSGVFEHAEDISGERMYETIHVKNETCYACAVRCKRVVQDENRGVEGRYGGPEYENLATLGSYCRINDLPAVALANQLCNIYGMDPIAFGATVGWAMDAFTSGQITGADTGGLEIEWGDQEMMLALAHMVAKREGFGDVLAEGMDGASQRLGGKGADLLTSVKGGALPAHMPQTKRSLALIYAVNPFGADHQSHEHDPSYSPGWGDETQRRMHLLGLDDPQDVLNLSDEKVRYAVIGQQLYSLLDSVSVCQFVFGPAWQLFGPDQLQQAIAAVTGWDMSIEELLVVGARKIAMMRQFNAREGIGREADILPKKLFKGLRGGPSDGYAVTEEQMASALAEYYRLTGLDPATGYPLPETLEKYEIAAVGD